ncbi:DNA-binding transcriptional LysR family regulator [Litorimonas taeanensis]|uniref:DNA-binding transcriptional LysR family regulator n=1 Tax=Litorimonas taeanensis TaxID=568099 RepID=A0A420WEA7_9PROT|nr:LysR family transcriptional regulator [Litorimonas taeanensis]RKQ69351.1 DNA-binding transcriptional LysR family regulator [Litorimonas taeanensis]
MNRYEEIEAFVRTIEAGSFTHAAKQLGVTKSAVSRRLSDLETRLGTQLIMRTTRSLSLTEAGQALFERAIGLLADWNEAETVSMSQTTALSGRIRMAAPLTFGVKYLGPAIIDFLALHPDIVFDIDYNDRKIDLISEGVDVAIRIGELTDSGLIARKLAPITMLACAAPAYLEKHGHPKTAQDLKHMKKLSYANRSKQSWHYTDNQGKRGEVTIPSALRSNNGDFLKNAAIAGLGIILHPSFIVCDALQDGSLKVILKDHNFASISAYAIYPPTRHLSLRVRTWVDFLVERFKDIPPWEMHIHLSKQKN